MVEDLGGGFKRNIWAGVRGMMKGEGEEDKAKWEEVETLEGEWKRNIWAGVRVMMGAEGEGEEE